MTANPPNINNEYNSVLNLRQFELAQSTKPFKARGFKLQRCNRCLIADFLCVCNDANPIAIDSRFLLIMYKGESIKPSNTGRLIAEILPNTKAFLWHRVDVNQLLLDAIDDDSYESYLVFPALYAEADRRVYHDFELNWSKLGNQFTINSDNELRQSEKKKQFIILDGTWTEAKKMFRKSPYLVNLPMLSLSDINAHPYLLREASRVEQLGTVSVGLSILNLLAEHDAYQSLLRLTQIFTHRYLSSKARNPQNLIKLMKLECDIKHSN
ncbi:tRNA-uridine aminocarboxypropyltransferase [Thorsellia anophelis]|uniref:tRNA-uridine aminocarboxypropyltransferase n=1 Tax=Thorsellia anophelis DSM 18579 TaxID=1123402 RepID=A0A1I0BKU7_9GAMM|nr:DTW domain-containing protein [Thorsellia anophelis]SET07615.1 conserved hypothetical protein [Thorsellia anophelis DSM 18579]